MSRKRLWAPWRLPYISGARDARGKRPKKCLFCEKGESRSDAKNLIVLRGKSCYAILNLYPYTNGHTLIAPYRHVGELGLLQKEEWMDLWRLTDEMIRRMKKVLSPGSFNVGANLGRAAGAGIPKHFHLHVVPRWIGDANFMSTVAGTRVISQSLRSAQRLLSRG